jgi:hypothetical protein
VVVASPSARFSVFALVIAMPTLTVAALGYVSLRQWERSAELLFREQARDVAAMAADKIEMVLRQSDDDVLARLAAIVERADLEPEALERFLRETPLVERLYVWDRAGHLLYPTAWREADAAVFAGLLAEISQGFWERGGRRDFVAGGRSILAAVLRGPDGAPRLAAVARSTEALQRDVFDRTLKNLDSPIVCVVVDAEGRPVARREPLAAASLIVTVPFRQALPTWRLALYQPPGAAPRQSVRRQIMLFTTAFGVLLVVIGAASS